jgi:hypothetical protein
MNLLSLMLNYIRLMPEIKDSNSFWDQIVGRKIKDIHIYKCKPYNSLYFDLPNEFGVGITMENDKKFILSHGLHDDSDTFSILPEPFLRDTEGLIKIKGLKLKAVTGWFVR